tara:strand:+ start:139 stop:537 length:399 start_codon:yes stop_codon:yes gene_type:complete
MNKQYLKKIIAQSPEDLQFISACCSQGKVKLSQIKHLPKSKIFLLSITRYNKESQNNNEKINSIIKFEFIESSKSKNINQNNKDLELELIAIDFFRKQNKYEIILLFSNNGFITLTAEIIEAVLEDQKTLND